MKSKIITLLCSLMMLALPIHAENTEKPPIPTKAVINKININKADINTLTGSFKGIGKKRAQAIVDYRDAHHGFKSIEELAEVKGIGQHFMDANREKLNELYVIK